MRSWTVVDAVVPVEGVDVLNLRETVWSYAMDQRAFGPRMFWMVFAEADGTMRGLPFTRRPSPVARSVSTPLARVLVAERGVHLVDWISCDDDRFRAARLHTMDLAEQPDWWDVPAVR